MSAPQKAALAPIETEGPLAGSATECAETCACEQADAALAVNPASGEGTYGQILKSSVLVGGSSVIGIFVRIIRTKAMAYLLGPAGFGLFGLYGAVETLTESIAGVGVNSSGVRQIAEAVGTGNTQRIAQTAAVLRRTSVILGLLGALGLIALARPVSKLTFGTEAHAGAIRVLALAVVFTLTSAGQAALIQGMRRIADLAKMSVIGTVSGALISIPVVYFFRVNGVVPSLVIVGLMTLLPSWWYSRKIEIRVPSITASEVAHEASALLKLGSVFMMGGLLLTSVAYLVRILLLRKVSLEAAGLYQSAWTMGGLYVAFIIQAMAADFYPRLTASANDNPLTNRLVNEQARVGLLLAGPGVLATLTYTPLVMTIFYTAKFTAAAEVMRWICVGTMLQVVTWPMGFVIVAKNRRALFFWCEITCASFYAALAWVCISYMGLNGAGIAFFAYCVFHGCLHYPIVGRLSGFRWSAENLREGIYLLVLIAVVWGAFRVLSPLQAAVLGTAAVAASSVYSMRTMVRLVPWNRIPRLARRVIRMMGFAPAGAAEIQ
jgi:PST family polysaccharide transporter